MKSKRLTNDMRDEIARIHRQAGCHRRPAGVQRQAHSDHSFVF